MNDPGDLYALRLGRALREALDAGIEPARLAGSLMSELGLAIALNQDDDVRAALIDSVHSHLPEAVTTWRKDLTERLAALRGKAH